MSGLIEFIKKHGRKLSISAQEWVAEREKDQKRLDYLDGDPTRIAKASARMNDKGASIVTAREAIDELMADAVEVG